MYISMHILGLRLYLVLRQCIRNTYYIANAGIGQQPNPTSQRRWLIIDQQPFHGIRNCEWIAPHVACMP
jgi:hypothetical protein